MIQIHEVPDGLLLSVEPFGKKNRNAACRIIAEIRSSQGKRRDVRFRVCNLDNTLTLSEMSLLMTDMRLLTDAVNEQMAKVQARAAKQNRKRG